MAELARGANGASTIREASRTALIRNSTPEHEFDARADLRAINAQIEQSYEALPYDEEADPVLDPRLVLGLGALYGYAANLTAAPDILDLGCGTGRLFEAIDAETRGKFVGTDISYHACTLARQRCKKFGDRARILCADFLDLTAAQLGTFDLIYCIGVIYVTPPPVRDEILKLVAACLKPGGVAVLSYYAGSVPLSRAFLHRTLCAASDPTQPFDTQIRLAREQMQQMAHQLPGDDPRRAQMIEALRETFSLPDTILFHEVLNPAFAAIETSALDSTLSARGVEFLNYLPPEALDRHAPRKRALDADTCDRSVGGTYRYAVFGKPVGSPQPLSVRSPAVLWQSWLERVEPTVAYGAPSLFRNFATGATLRVTQAAAQALLDELAVRPAAWEQISDSVHHRLRRSVTTADPIPQLEHVLIDLWEHSLVAPIWIGA